RANGLTAPTSINADRAITHVDATYCLDHLVLRRRLAEAFDSPQPRAAPSFATSQDLPLMEYRSIGEDFPPVSALSLGSWNTFSRMSFEDCMTLLERSLERGINFFDVAFYWDKPHTEIIFGRAMEVLGVSRSAYMLAEKLWLWDYPQQSF